MRKCQFYNLLAEVLESIVGSFSWEFALGCNCLWEVSVFLWWWDGSVTSCIMNTWVVDEYLFWNSWPGKQHVQQPRYWRKNCEVCIFVTLSVRCRRKRPSGTRTERSTAWRQTASSSCTRGDLFAAGKRSAACGGRCLSEAVSTPSAGPALPSGRERWLVSTLCLKSVSFHLFF